MLDSPYLLPFAVSAIVGVLIWLAAWASGYRSGTREAEDECHYKYEALRKAGLSLYMSGPWHTSSHQLPPHEQMILWNRMREALKLDPGTATTLKVAHMDIAPSATESLVEEWPVSSAIPLAGVASEALEEAYMGSQAHAGIGPEVDGRDVVCWCGKDRLHQGPHASPIA